MRFKLAIIFLILFLSIKGFGDPVEYLDTMQEFWLQEVPICATMEVWATDNYIPHPDGYIWPPDDTWYLWQVIDIDMPACAWHGIWEYGGPIPDGSECVEAKLKDYEYGVVNMVMFTKMRQEAYEK